jgi:hypothetical protein
MIDKKLPIINISLSRKKSVFGNEFFNNKYFKYDYYNNLKERSYSNNQKKIKNYFEDNNYKSMYLTKRNPNTKGSLSYFK